MMEFKLPEIGEGVYEAELVSWLVQPGDVVKSGQPLLEVMTDKATMEVPSPFAGTIGALSAETGEKIKVGDVVLRYEPSSSREPHTPVVPEVKREANKPVHAVSSNQAPVNGPATVTAPARIPVKAAPSVRHLARKMNIDLGRVRGTGPQGRVLLEDLTTYLQPTGDRESAPQEPAFELGRPGSSIKMQGLRRMVAEHMVLAKQNIPHYSYVDECDVTELVKLRGQLREPYTQAGIKLTYLAFFVKAAVAALKAVPLVNSSLDEEAGEIVLHDRYHIGIAVATPTGLIVPVIHDADRKDLGTLAREIERLSGEARAGRAKREDLRGGTFTITSVGNLGGLISTPVINHPEVAILGVGKVVKRPVFDEQGQIRAADLVYLSLSFDHRVVDGAIGAVFTNALIASLSQPARLLVPF